MPIRWAVAAGSIDTPANWDGGTLPTSADDVYLNNFAMTAAAGADVTWLSLSNASNVSPAINAGGTLTITGARNFTITAMIPRTDAAIANGMIQINAATGTVSITGEARAGGAGSSSFCINRTGNCNFVFNGTVTPVAGSAAFVINMAGTGTVTMGSVGTPITLAVAATNLIQINNASINANIWANQFHGGAVGTALTLAQFNIANTFGPCYGGSASTRIGISTTSSVSTSIHTHWGDCYAGTGGSSPAGLSKSGLSQLVLNGKLITNSTYNINNACVVIGGTFTLNGDGTPRDIEHGSSQPLNITGAATTYTLNINQIVRPVQSNITTIAVGTNSTGTSNVTMPIVGGSAGSSAAAFSLGSGNHTLNAPSVTGGGIASCPGVTCQGNAGSLATINANCFGNDFTGANGVNVGGVGATVVINGKSTGNGYGVGGVVAGAAAGVAVTVLATVSVREVESGPSGQSGIIGPVLMLPSALNKSTYRQTVNGPTTELVPSGGGGIQSYGFMS